MYALALVMWSLWCWWHVRFWPTPHYLPPPTPNPLNSLFCTSPIECPDLHNIQPSKLLFGTVMYDYHMDQNPKKPKPKNFIFGTTTHLYELIFHPRIEEGQTYIVRFIRKKSFWSRKIWEISDLRFLLLPWTSIAAAKICNLKFKKNSWSNWFFS